MNKNWQVLAFIIVVCFTVSGYLYSDFLSFESLKQQHIGLRNLYQSNIAIFSTIFFALLLIASALPLPFVAILIIAAGALYGFTVSLIFVSITCTLGASICFLYIRLFTPQRFSNLRHEKADALIEELTKAPLFYAICIRLVPGLPFFIGNAILSLSSIRLHTFAISTLLGMLPMFVILILAGSQLNQYSSVSDIVTAQFALSMFGAITVLVLSRALVLKYIV